MDPLRFAAIHLVTVSASSSEEANNDRRLTRRYAVAVEFARLNRESVGTS